MEFKGIWITYDEFERVKPSACTQILCTWLCTTACGLSKQSLLLQKKQPVSTPEGFLGPMEISQDWPGTKADWSTLNSGCCQDGVWWIASGCKTTKATSHQPILYSWAASKYRVYLHIWSRQPPPAPPATIPHKGDQPSRGHGECLWWNPAKEGSGNVGER
jgi:hypothetical protein